MDFTFFNQPSPKQVSLLKLFSPANKIFARLKWNIEIVRKPANDEMITIEQRINLFHLANEMLVHNIEGDFIELGCYTGHSALQIQSILENFKADKKFHVYDAFNLTTEPETNFKNIFIDNFIKANMTVPEMHEGYFSETLPTQLPDKIAFAHIDCTTGNDQESLRKNLFHILENVYPRLTPNAVCLIMDYHDTKISVGGSLSFPGVKQACDLFFKNKPEKVYVLYGNHFAHGYFRKGSHNK